MNNVQQSQKFPDCFYRVTIKGMCVRDGKLLMVRETTSSGEQKWELPGGGLDFGSTIKDDFQREVEEEMGVPVSKMSELPVYVWTWRYEKHRHLDWFYTLVLAFRVEFEHLNIQPSQECQEIKFFSESEIKDLELSKQMTPLPDFFKASDFDSSF